MIKRLKEPSTYAGLAAIIAGIGQIFNVNEAPAISDTVINAAPSIISGDWLGALMISLGSLAIILKEKANGK